MAFPAILNVWRSGYLRGYRDGESGNRCLADWELMISAPIVWIPTVSTAKYIAGYQNGFADGIKMRCDLQQITTRFR